MIPSKSTPFLLFLRWLPLLILAVTVCTLFYRLLTGEVLFWALPALQFYPWRAFTRSELAAGRLPLWNPYNGGGAPLIANYQSALFYPPNLLTTMIPGAGVIGFLGMIHLIWAGVGMWLFLGHIGCTGLGRGVGALAFGLNTAVVARFGTPPMVDVAAWLPWIMLAGLRLITHPTAINGALLAIATAMLLLAGHAQWAFYSLGLSGLAALYHLTHLTPPDPVRVLTPPLRWRRGGWGVRLTALIAALLLGLLLAAIQLIPTAELQAGSQRASGAGEAFALNYSYETPLLATLFNPNFFGNPGDGSYIIPGVYFETAAYVGILPVVVALATMAGWLRFIRRRVSDPDPLRRWIPFFGVTSVIALAFAFGKHSPIYPALFRYVPTFNAFQAPVRWLIWLVFGWSALAGIGLTVWRVDRLLKMRFRLLFAGAALLSVMALIGKVTSGGTILDGVLGLGVGLMLTSALFVAQPNPTKPGWGRWAVIVLLFVAGDLAWANRLSNPTTAPDFYDTLPPQSQPSRAYIPDGALQKRQFDDILVFNDYRIASQKRAEYRTAGFPNMNMLDRITLFNTFEPLRPAWIEKFTRLLDDHPAANLTQAAAISTLDTPTPPRLWIAGTAIGSADPFQSMSDPTWNPYKSVFLEGGAPTFRGLESATDSVTITAETPQALEMTVNSSGSPQSVLVMADSWYPGWRATVDGVEVPIYRANGAFRGVVIASGTHAVRIHYEPASLKVGGVLSLGAAVVVIGLLVMAYGVPGRRRPPTRQ